MKRRTQDSIIRELKNNVIAIENKIVNIQRNIEISQKIIDKKTSTLEVDVMDAFTLHLIRDAAKKIKKKQRIVFIGTGNLHDNTVAVYKALVKLELNKKYEVIYLAASKEEEFALKQPNLNVTCWEYQSNLAVTIMEAALIVFNSHLFSLPRNCLLNAYCSGSKKIQLWHGAPAKSIGFDTIKYVDNIHFVSSIAEDTLNFDYLTIQTEDPSFVNEYAKGFPNAKIFITGDPRTDVLFLDDNMTISDKFKIFLYETFGKKRILIAPTFYDDLDSHEKMIQSLDKLIDLLLEENFSIALQFHSVGLTLYPEIHSNFYKKNIYMIDNRDMNFYVSLKYFDALITDWSSIRFDFLAVNKPIILWRPVIHIRSEKNSIFNFLDQAALLINTEDSNTINNILNYLIEDPHVPNRKLLLNKYYAYQDGKSADRVALLLEHLLLESK